jgi:hypothetical protein
MPNPFDQFLAAILDLIVLRQSRLDAMLLPDPDLEAELEDLETGYLELVDKTSPADQEAIRESYREALEVFGSNEGYSANTPTRRGCSTRFKSRPSGSRCERL